MEEDIKNILGEAVYAPSGANAQPWQFEVSGNVIDIFVRPVRFDLELKDFRLQGTDVDHGALVETIVIVATEYGYRTEVVLLPDSTNQKLTARLTLIKEAVAPDPLYKQIRVRTTNRRAYDGTPLTPEEKETLSAIVRQYAQQLSFVDTQPEKKRLSHLLGTSEQFIFENKAVHDGTFGFFEWNKEALDGLPVASLDFSPFTLFMLRQFRSWPFTHLLKPFKIGEKIADQTADRTNTSGAVCAFIADTSSGQHFLQAGQALQRLWLAATEKGLYLQPLFTFTYVAQEVRAGQTIRFNPEEIQLITKRFTEVEELFGSQGHTITAVFRIGHAEPPSFHPLRRPPEIKFRDA